MEPLTTNFMISRIGAYLALGVLVLTADLGRPRPGGGGDLKYWRGRRIDDERRGRWN